MISFFLRNAFPDNLLKIAFTIYKSKYVPHYKNDTNTNNTVIDYWQVKTDTKEGLNIVGVALCSIIFGLVLSSLKTKAKSFYEMIEVINQVSINLIIKIMWYVKIALILSI